MMLNTFPYVYRIFQRICLIKSGNILLIITYQFVLFFIYRYAANPGKYPDEALSQHYDTFHPGTSPDLVFSIFDKELSTVKRKIKEAFYISNEKPSINKKDECVVLERFLVKH